MVFYLIIICMKKLLDSDWLRAEQFKCNTSANYSWKFWILIGWKTTGNFLSQCAETLKKVFSSEKNGCIKSRKVYSGTSSTRIFFMFILFISNHTVFLVQFGINLHLWVFQKAEIALAEAARAISAYHEKLTRANYRYSKPYDYLFLVCTHVIKRPCWCSIQYKMFSQSLDQNRV